jgi:GT2 family glycosyltransferase
MTAHPRVVAVVVAWNRRDLVVETLAALRAQTAPLHAVVVIDNASTDGSGEVIRERFPDIALTTLPTNTGGAGGFTVGIERALTEHDTELVWLMDDDTVPDPGALDELLRARAEAPRGTVVLASAVRWTDGRPHPMNTPRTRPSASRRSIARAARHGCTPVRTASFVSMMIEADAIRAHGTLVSMYVEDLADTMLALGWLDASGITWEAVPVDADEAVQAVREHQVGQGWVPPGTV